MTDLPRMGWCWGEDMSFTAVASGIGDWFAGAGLLGGAIAFSFGALQYVKAQAWKRAEFLALEFKAFMSDPFVARVLLVLDWHQRKVFLQRKGYPEEALECNVDCGVLQNALRVMKRYDDHAPGFEPHEVALRDSFDSFLDGVEQLGAHASSGLIQVKDLVPYVEYYLDIIFNPASTRMAPDAKQAIQNYVKEYDYVEVLALAERLGHPRPA